jgi:hypothetical protein
LQMLCLIMKICSYRIFKNHQISILGPLFKKKRKEKKKV